MSASTELLFLGLPETGKTTFLVALDEILETEQHGLVSNGFSSNRTYLENAKKVWRAGESISRTNLQPANEPIELLVRHAQTGTEARLTAPDVYGEFYDDQWADRKWPISYRQRLSSIAGIMVFISAKKNGRNPEMTKMWREHASPGVKVKPWEPRFAAEQVKLADLLQLIAENQGTQKPLRLAVMVSAWDLIEPFDAPSILPQDHMMKDWSLMHQYLRNNPEAYDSRFFGVSARGGSDEAKQKLVLQSPPERVWLKDGTEITRDLTIPLRWLLGWP